MASTTALFTGLSGLTVNSRQLDVIGNNIANVNTTGYKSSRMLLSSTFSRLLNSGSGPGEFSGGTNPTQVGLGASIAGTQRDFTNGAITTTGRNTDLAIEGSGMFIVENGSGQFFTRVGAFERDADNTLVTANGDRVLGFGVDDQFRITGGEPAELSIPIGSLTIAQATQNVLFSGQLNASGDLPTTGSVHSAAAMYINGNDPPDSPMAGTEDLTAGGTDLFVLNSAGVPTLAIEGGSDTVITVSGVEKAGKDLGTHTFAFSTDDTLADAIGSTMNDFTSFLEQIFGLDPALGGSVTIDGNGQVIVAGNNGTVQDLDLSTASFEASSTTNNGLKQPFTMGKTADADGESVRTSFIAYDSLGTPMTVDLSFVIDSVTEGEGTTWRFIAESNDNDALNRLVGTGLVTFDAEGQFVTSDPGEIQMERDNGAETPQVITLQFDGEEQSIAALTSTESQVTAINQDGSSIGTLSGFSIGGDGVITGAFTNGLNRTLGQIALANFTNLNGLVDVGNNLFQPGPNSGDAQIGQPGQFGTGQLIGGALEMSNVDLSQEFINMILASTGYSASSRVITTTNDLIDQLLLLGR